MKQIMRQILLLPAATWCRLVAIDVYRLPDYPSIVDRTKLYFLSFGLPFLLTLRRTNTADI